MKYVNKKVEDLKIAYIGGGSRGWAWGLMSDLASAEDISGQVALYDIDFEAAKANEVIGNKYNDVPGCLSKWSYKAEREIGDALTGADFVVISILPGTFDEMASDVHLPERVGVYQPVGDTVGPGGIIRALRTLPMFEVIGKAIRDYCPNAWVINYTNPMTMCMRTLYKTFPGIKAFGCCHEVFGTQKVLAAALEDMLGIEKPDHKAVKVNVVGVNHFTWLTDAHYENINVMEVYKDFCEKYHETGFTKGKDDNWMNNIFESSNRVKMDLFRKYGSIAAAGDRHLAEYSEGNLYLQSRDQARSWGFDLTPVSWRWENLEERLEMSRQLLAGEREIKINNTGEEGVNQIRALLGLHTLVTNVNLPNYGQIPNLPLGAVVETNAVFQDDTVTPVFAGNIPMPIYGQITRALTTQEMVVEAAMERNLEKAFAAFRNDPLVSISDADARKLFNEMVENTKAYLTE
mgnify:CR=1 FL=1